MHLITNEGIISTVNAIMKNVELTCQDMDVNLTELGMDSITFIQVVVALEEEFECEIPDSKLLLTEMDTLNKLKEVLQTVYRENHRIDNSPEG